MPDSFETGNRARNVAIAGISLFVVVLVLLAAQMASGHDPALGAGKPAKPVKRVAAAPQPADPPQPSYQEPTYDDGAGYSTDNGSGYSDDGAQNDYVAPQQDTQQQYTPQPAPQQQAVPQQQSQAPLQSTTS